VTIEKHVIYTAGLLIREQFFSIVFVRMACHFGHSALILFVSRVAL
jgi:hypothetical protein